MRKMIVMAAAATALISHPALAYITLDAANGTGYVGKGEVIYAYAWSKSAALTNAPKAKFHTATVTEYDAVCEWDTLAGGRNSLTTHFKLTMQTAINSTVDYESSGRKATHSLRGWNLTGNGPSAIIGMPFPAIGDTCAAGADSATGIGRITTVVQTIGPRGTLYADFNSDSKPVYYF